MGVRRRVLSIMAKVARRHPQRVFAGAMAAPWALFAVSGRADSAWFPILDLAMVVGAAAGVVVGVVRLGVHARKWPVVVGVYAAAVNFGIAEFAYLYWSASQAERSAFSAVLSKADGAYFSWTTFTTTGFGDIAARSEFARLAVTSEMALTFVAVAGGLAVLVSARGRDAA